MRMLFLVALLLPTLALASGKPFSESHDEFTGTTTYTKTVRSARIVGSMFGIDAMGVVLMKVKLGEGSDQDKALSRALFSVGIEIASEASSLDDRPLYVKADGEIIQLPMAPGTKGSEFNRGTELAAAFWYAHAGYFATLEQAEKIGNAKNVEIRVYHENGDTTKSIKASDIRQWLEFVEAMKRIGMTEPPGATSN